MSFLSKHLAFENGTVDPVTGKPPAADHSDLTPAFPGHQPKQNNTHVAKADDEKEQGTK